MIDLGLQRISRLMADTPMPWRAIHVAGTNGKGSVCSYISEILRIWNTSMEHEVPYERKGEFVHKRQIKHGRFTSPFLVDPWDCISVSNRLSGQMEMISASVYQNIMKEVAERNQKLDIKATNFELLTATAFETFTKTKVDLAVVEVGMGGRLDSTNVIGQSIEGDQNEQHISMSHFRPPPLVNVITKIGLDHQGFLGNTIEEIAHEKAGIIKQGVPVVYDGSNERSVCEIIESVARSRSAPSISRVIAPSTFPRIPPHHRQNYHVAEKATTIALEQMGISESSFPYFECRDLLHSDDAHKIPGRQEPIDLSPLLIAGNRTPTCWLDGAHNAQSAEALGDSIRRGTGRVLTWILAASDSKDMTSILRPLLRPGDTVFAVEFGPVEGMEWVKPMKSRQIVEYARQVVPDLAGAIEYGRDILGAIRDADKINAGAALDQKIVITGSLYLVGDVYRLLRDHKWS